MARPHNLLFLSTTETELFTLLNSRYLVSRPDYCYTICARIGAVKANAPTQTIVWGHCPHTLPSSSYKYVKYYYIAILLKICNFLPAVNAETIFA